MRQYCRKSSNGGVGGCQCDKRSAINETLVHIIDDDETIRSRLNATVRRQNYEGWNQQKRMINEIIKSKKEKKKKEKNSACGRVHSSWCEFRN